MRSVDYRLLESRPASSSWPRLPTPASQDRSPSFLTQRRPTPACCRCRPLVTTAASSCAVLRRPTAPGQSRHLHLYPATMADDSVLVAAAQVVASLVADPRSSSSISLLGSKITLPGSQSAAKRNLEIELQKLILRVSQLESRAVSSSSALPQTPSEVNDSLFGDDTGSSNSGSRPLASKPRPVHAHQGSLDSPNIIPRQLTREALEGLREHVDDQTKLLDSQRQELAGVNAQLLEQKQLQERALEVLEQERVATLERELWKHQKANEAFQKALREIGEIVTAVARGDLTMKVRMNTVEMDPEITTFKRTINAMMDQLQVFASEVSRVAREVGTEGLLGGQARIGGVDGTWKELTDNGLFAAYRRRAPAPLLTPR